MKVPFVSLVPLNREIKEKFLAAVEKIVDKGDFILGSEVKNFETAYASYSGTRYCVGVNSGLDALKIALKAAGIKAGDEVIVPANTFIATWLAVSETGATPVPVDAEKISGNINVALIDAAITKNTKAIIPVHLYGLPCNMDEVMQLSAKYNLQVIEDNAQAQGATYKGKPTGSIGHINATSFYPSKNLGAAGDGGAITTNSADLWKRTQLFRNYGSEEKYIHLSTGYNSRLDTLQAAFLNCKLSLLNHHNEYRIQSAHIYNELLKPLSELQLPQCNADRKHIYHLYTIRTNHRDNLREHLAAHGIETGIHYPLPPHLQKAYAHLGWKKGAFPVTEEISATTLSLPMYYGLHQHEIEYVCKHIKSFFG
ncbi:MAG: DegT/DnrJ/EryC1/StrS family aminotransferase [Chitinophagales bacterium]|nr:DegT/DnrJ/EryC1/StrS family aminotransferase [Chitinophagales bacterium]